MSSKPGVELTEDIYSLLMRVVDKRRTYPTKIIDCEQRRFEKEMKRLEDIKVNTADDYSIKQMKLLCSETCQLYADLPASSPSVGVEIRFTETRSNYKEIMRFLELTK